MCVCVCENLCENLCGYIHFNPLSQMYAYAYVHYFFTNIRV